MHVLSAGLIGGVTSPERKCIWLPDLPRFIERRDDRLWERLRLRNAFEVL